MVKTLVHSVPPAQLLINLVDCTGIKGAYHLSDINRLGRPLNNSKGFFQNQQNNLTKWHLAFAIQLTLIVFRLIRDWRLERLANGKEISAVLF